MDLWSTIAARIAAVTRMPFSIDQRQRVSGGDINHAYVLTGGGRSYFIKVRTGEHLDMFEAEAEGLEALAATRAIRVPEPVCCGQADRQSFLAMEYLPLSHAIDMEAFGRRLCEVHRSSAEAFGWQRDNTIGSSPQANGWSKDWVAFWRQHRLGFQLRLAQQNGHGNALQDLGGRLLEALPAFFTDYRPIPSLLHGDLWGGNSAGDGAGNPVIFDPAVYYGDREADLAMTELFGGLGQAFYAAYRDEWPLDRGYSVRKDLYNLYHILNHLNLFGAMYARQAERLIGRLLSESGC